MWYMPRYCPECGSRVKIDCESSCIEPHEIQKAVNYCTRCSWCENVCTETIRFNRNTVKLSSYILNKTGINFVIVFKLLRHYNDYLDSMGIRLGR